MRLEQNQNQFKASKNIKRINEKPLNFSKLAKLLNYI